MSEYRYLQVKTENGVVVARFSDERLTEDLAIASVGEELRSLANDKNCRKVLLNFAVVSYLSSTMIGKLISMNKKVKANGGELKFCELGPHIQELAELTGLNQIIDIRDTEAEGIKAFE